MQGQKTYIPNCLRVKKPYQSMLSDLIDGSAQVISLSTFLVLFSFIMVVVSCTSVTNNKPAVTDLPQTSENSAEHSKPEYILQIGDLMEIKFLYDPQLNEGVKIRPDGRISLQIVDEVEAAGLTPAQLDAILTEKYSRVLTKPEVAVIVREFAGQKIYVGGEVASPGLINLNSHMTAMEAIFSAGGFRETAEPGSVIVLRRSPKNTRMVRKVDLKNVLAGNPTEQNLVLRPFDVVYVPKTFISKANKFVEQYLSRMIPRWLSADFSYTKVRQ
jgi:protein involved in polysaccharide export with SLBB domain